MKSFHLLNNFRDYLKYCEDILPLCFLFVISHDETNKPIFLYTCYAKSFSFQEHKRKPEKWGIGLSVLGGSLLDWADKLVTQMMGQTVSELL